MRSSRFDPDPPPYARMMARRRRERRRDWLLVLVAFAIAIGWGLYRHHEGSLVRPDLDPASAAQADAR